MGGGGAALESRVDFGGGGGGVGTKGKISRFQMSGGWHIFANYTQTETIHCCMQTIKRCMLMRYVTLVNSLPTTRAKFHSETPEL